MNSKLPPGWALTSRLTCDTCGKDITDPDDAWVEWIDAVDAIDWRQRVRLVHHRRLSPSCATDRVTGDDHLTNIIRISGDPDGVKYLRQAWGQSVTDWMASKGIERATE